MSNFYIKSVTAKGNGRADSTVNFQPGLNIIKGRSNTGKTVIIKCIDFCFGSKIKPFDENFGYTTIEMQLHTLKGDITISRKLGKNQVEVITDILGFCNGTYDLNHSTERKALPNLSDLLLASIGIEGEHQIIKNKNFEKRRLTWRTFLRVLLFHVTDIAKSTSIIEPEQAVEKTSMLSALLFLFFGKEFTEQDAQVKKEIRDARKNAVEEYVNKKLQLASDKKKELQKSLAIFSGENIEQKIQEIIVSLQNTEHQISQTIKQSREFTIRILALQDKAAECSLLQTRYASLKTQYVSDIKRLSFIVNGESQLSHVHKIQTCPFCEGKLPPKKDESYLESAKAELSRTLIQIKGLENAENDIAYEKKQINKSLYDLQSQRKQLDQTIEKELRPKADFLKQLLTDYRTYIQIQQELQMLDDISSSMITDLRKLPVDDTNQIEYHPRKYFDALFQECINDMLLEALRDCRYENLNTARFNMSSLDIEINGHKKADMNGQGYCAFLNSVIAVVFRSYMENYAKYNPGFVIIDTPLLGLDQGIDDNYPESMRTALFNFFIKHQTDGQIIILENILHLPNIDFAKAGANVITFTKGLEDGRYGFLNDVE